MGPGSRFKPVLTDLSVANPDNVKRVAFLSGKLYYDLLKARQQHSESQERVALVRIEEICPFPFRAIEEELQKYRNATEIVWVQEEPRNQGAWSFVESRLRSTLEHMNSEQFGCAITYIGRKEDALPAPGIAKLYKSQQQAILDAVFDGI